MQESTSLFLRQAAPAALATQPGPGVSERYSFFPTWQVLDALAADGWAIHDAKQIGARQRYPKSLNHARHEIMLVSQDVIDKVNVFKETPRIILSNAHDGNAQYKMRAGLFVSACLNGHYVPDGLIHSVSIRHSRRTIEEVVATAQGFRANADLIREHVAHFKAVELSDAQAVEFTRQAIGLRHQDAKAVVEIQDLLKPQREQDAGNRLWQVFNRTQEYIIKGGYPVYHQRKNEWAGHRARPIRGIDQTTQLNTALWNLAELFSKN